MVPYVARIEAGVLRGTDELDERFPANEVAANGDLVDGQRDGELHAALRGDDSLANSTRLAPRAAYAVVPVAPTLGDRACPANWGAVLVWRDVGSLPSGS